MDPVQILKDEHRVIERVLDALDRYVDKSATVLPSGEKAELLLFVEFIQEFADRCHHGKEEDILFAEMLKVGFPREAGPLGVMFHEHQQGRAFVSELKRLGEQKEPWTDADREQLFRAASGYVTLLRQHIRKEDGVLYPMAEAQLPAEAMRSIGQRFQEFDRRQAGTGEHERLHRLGEELTSRHVDSTASQ